MLPAYKAALDEYLPQYCEELKNNHLECITQLFHILFSHHLPKENPFNVIVLLEGLDEMAADGRDSLLLLIKDNWKFMPSWIKLIASSQPDESIVKSLRKFKTVVLGTDDVNNLEDIKTFLSRKIKLYLIDKSQLDQAAFLLQQRSEGLFQIAYFQQECITSGKYALNSLSLEDFQAIGNSENMGQESSLETIYTKFFRRFLKGTLAEYHSEPKKIYKKLLSSMVASREPISEDFFCRILKTPDDSDGMDSGSIDRLLGKLKSIAIFSNDDEIRFSLDKSIYDFLITTGDENLAVDVSEDHRYIANTFIHYPADISDFASRHRIYHLRKASGFEKEFNSKLVFNWIEAALLQKVDPMDIVNGTQGVENMDAVLLFRFLEMGLKCSLI